MTKNEVTEMLLHLKEECNKHPKAKSIKCNKFELLEIADYFLDLVGRIELLSVSKEFNREEHLMLAYAYNRIGENLKNLNGYENLYEVTIKSIAREMTDNLAKYLDISVLDDPLTCSFVYKANLCVLKRKEY